MTPNEDVISKIRKLLSLAANNPSEAEAASAAAKAQEMMAAYNLEMHEIQSKAPQSAAATQSTKRVKHTHTRSGLFEYQRSLWEAVAKVNMCWYQATPEIKVNTLGHTLIANYRHYMIGSEANVTGACIMAEYLEDAIKRLCPYKVGKPMFSWREGCAARLVERLNTKRYEMERESELQREEAVKHGGSSTAVVLADVFLTEDDLNYAERFGQEAMEKRRAYRHDRANCVCEHCVADREYWQRVKEQQAVTVPEKPETDAQRRKREEREARQSDRYWEAQERKERRKWAAKDMDAYQEGQRKGAEINLDKQVRDGSAGRLK